MRYLIVFISCIFFFQNCQQKHNNKISSEEYDYLRTVLEEILETDQNPRLNGAPWAEIIQQDSLNLKKVIAIIEEYGWIDSSKVGSKAASALFFVIQHADLEYQEKYFPLFEQAVDRGEASMHYYAMMTDRILMHQGKKQRYGTQASSGRLRGRSQEMLIWPIENPNIVNELRKEVGIEMTIEEYAEMMDAEYNPNEELPD